VTWAELDSFGSVLTFAMMRLPLSLLLFPLHSTTALVTKQQKCGAAIGGVDGNSCARAVWAPTHDKSRHCIKYGGHCTLNCYAPEHDTGKNPEECHTQSKTFYLWDEPDTNCHMPEPYKWAGKTWLAYSKRWAAEIKRMRAQGYKFTTPMVKGDHIKDNLNAFYAGCGAPCSDKNDAAYININAINCFCGTWNNGDCRAGAEFCVREAEAASQKRMIYVTNWSFLGETATVEQNIRAMEGTSGFFTSKSVKRVYWFGARDVGGGSAEKVHELTNKGPKGQTLGEYWARICSKL